MATAERKYHPSVMKLNEHGKLVLDKDKYDALTKEVKGHDPNCAWEGYVDAKTCGCKKGK